MTIKVDCPDCGVVVRAPDTSLPTGVTCSFCGKVLVEPAASRAGLEPRAAAPESGDPSRSPTPKAAAGDAADERPSRGWIRWTLVAVLLLAYVGVLLISCANDDVLHGYPAWHVFELGLGSLARFHGYASVLGLLVEVLAVSLLVVGAIKFLFDRNRVGLLVLAIGWLVWGGLTYVRVQPVLTEVRAGNDEVRQLARSAGALDDDVVAQVRALAKDDRAMRVFHEMRRRQAEGVLRTMDSAAVATMEVRMHMGRTLEALLERRVSERSDVVLFLPSILVGLFLVSGAVLLRRR